MTLLVKPQLVMLAMQSRVLLCIPAALLSKQFPANTSQVATELDHVHERPGGRSWLLASAWPRYSCYMQLVSDPADKGISLFFLLPLSFCVSRKHVNLYLKEVKMLQEKIKNTFNATLSWLSRNLIRNQWAWGWWNTNRNRKKKTLQIPRIVGHV